MSFQVASLFFLAILIRLSSFLVSLRNEKYLKQSGAVEYGKLNSVSLMVSHTFIYIFSFLEANIKKVQFDVITLSGAFCLLLSVITLIIVIYQLEKFWTFKLYIAKDHRLNQSLIFKYLKHPNYFLNVIPELIAVILICKAWLVLLILFPIHLILLGIRINQENTVMKNKFAQY